MKIDWDIGDIDGWEELWEEDVDGARLNRITVSLIDATALVGIPEISEANWRTFAARVAAWQAAVQTLVVIPENDWYTPLMVTHGDVRRHIGLKTTAVPADPAEFERRMVDTMERLEVEGPYAWDSIAARPLDWGVRIAAEAGPEDLPQPARKRPGLRVV